MIKYMLVLLFGLLPLNAFNNGFTVQQIEHYYASGEFAQEVQAQLDSAYKHLQALKVQEKSTIIFDIDDTVISHWRYQVDCAHRNLNPDDHAHEYLLEASTPAIKEVQEFYHKVKALGFKIIFLSSRLILYHECTLKVLLNNNYTGYTELILKTPQEAEKYGTAAEYKQNKRKELAQTGYNIVACIGDQESDLIGDNTGLAVKLPNPLYCNRSVFFK